MSYLPKFSEGFRDEQGIKLTAG